jgi:hypothetical protein
VLTAFSLAFAIGLGITLGALVVIAVLGFIGAFLS